MSARFDPVLAVEVHPKDLAALEAALVVLEEAGVPLVRIPAESLLGPAGPLFAVCEATSPLPVKYVFYIRLPAELESTLSRMGTGAMLEVKHVYPDGWNATPTLVEWAENQTRRR